MAYGQPYYNYGTNPYGGQNNGYMAQQQPQYGNFYGQPQNAPQNANMGVTQQYQQPVQNTQQGLNRSDIIPMMYATYAEATAYRVEPMQKMMFSITDKPLFMLKQADINGRTMVEEYPITPKQTAEPTGTPKTANLDDFIKRNELDNYATVERLEKAIKAVTNDFSKQIEELKRTASKGVNKNA